MTDHEMLEALLTKMSGLTDTVGSLNDRFDGLSGRVKDLTGAFGSLNDSVAKVAVTQENVLLPQLNALAEGHKIINDKLVPQSRIDQMQGEIDFLKAVVKANTLQINELKNTM
jgi:hypothetical protein